ncbi:importin alpha, putative [Eimeria brunetti]|uniref:Importin alpha, putative n=1 Tax=Eimeria brunetti TaxID=51314 RepID=U6LEE1_9EIME|nr:importin alpha, putative [Eimeria brunetti]
MERRVADRKANFKKNFEDPRRKREDLQVQIRKSQREQNLAKKRAEALDEAKSAAGGPPDAAAAAAAAAQGGGPFNLEGVDLQQLVQALASGVPEAELQATQCFRRALSIENNPPIQEVIDAGAVPHFVRFLSMTGREQLQFEAAWALTNIASGTQEQTRVVIDCGAVPLFVELVVIDCGAVPLFVELLRCPKEDVREQAVWALGNIAGDSPTCRDLVLNSGFWVWGGSVDSGALQPLLEQLNTPLSKLAMLRNATWTLSNLCRGKPAPAFEKVSPALSTLGALIYSDDSEGFVLA